MHAEARARAIRLVVVGICGLGVAGMIGGSIAERTGLAITAGVVAAVAVLCLIAVTAVVGPKGFGAPAVVDESLAAELERRIEDLVAAGCDEAEVRSAVRLAMRVERTRTSPG